jgi:hypothetical protein
VAGMGRRPQLASPFPAPAPPSSRLHVKPGDVSKALSGARLDTIYGPGLTIRAANNQLVLPNFVGRVNASEAASSRAAAGPARRQRR